MQGQPRFQGLSSSSPLQPEGVPQAKGSRDPDKKVGIRVHFDKKKILDQAHFKEINIGSMLLYFCTLNLTVTVILLSHECVQAIPTMTKVLESEISHGYL